MIPLPPSSTRTYTLFPSTTLFRSPLGIDILQGVPEARRREDQNISILRGSRECSAKADHYAQGQDTERDPAQGRKTAKTGQLHMKSTSLLFVIPEAGLPRIPEESGVANREIGRAHV